MAVNMHSPKQTNWWVWGGVGVAAVVLIAVLGYGFDWFAGGTTNVVAPAVEQSVPATE